MMNNESKKEDYKNNWEYDSKEKEKSDIEIKMKLND